MSKEKQLAQLYKSIINGVATNEEVMHIIAQLVYQTIQSVIFSAARDSGYDMQLLKKELGETIDQSSDEEGSN